MIAVAALILLPTIFLILGLAVGYNAGYASARHIGRWPDPSRVREILEKKRKTDRELLELAAKAEQSKAEGRET